MSYKAIGKSDVFLNYMEKLDSLSEIKRPILIIGERGSGKEAAAKRIHGLSKGSERKPYVIVNCGSLPESLIDSELFGHKKGSFTGSTGDRQGRFEEADGGTLFLDEIGLIPFSVQEKILRVVEYGTYYSLGDNKEKKVNVRIICATNADLPKLCEEGKFKKDLLDRLSFEVVYVPPLRFRGDDILLLADYFGNMMNSELGNNDLIEIIPSVQQQLLSYDWPGNIRELKNVIERATVRALDSKITKITINPFTNPYGKTKKTINNNSYFIEQKKEIELDNFKQAKVELEIEYLKAALKKANNKQTEAAKLLGINYDQIRGLYRKHKDKL